MVRVDVNCGAEDLGDDFVDGITGAWPRLRGFHIGEVYPDWVWRPSGCTLESIRLFAERCPELRELTFPFRACMPIGDHDRLGRGVVNKNLTALDVGRSTIQDPSMVAMFLAGVFPNIDGVRFDAWRGYGYGYDEDEEGGRYHDLWWDAMILYEEYRCGGGKGEGM